MIHKKKAGVTVRPRSLNPGKAIAMAICPVICSFCYLARVLMHDVAYEFACAEPGRMHRNNYNIARALVLSHSVYASVLKLTNGKRHSVYY